MIIVKGFNIGDYSDLRLYNTMEINVRITLAQKRAFDNVDKSCWHTLYEMVYGFKSNEA